ncbi:hypothetical protein BD779DRAFT_1579271, partial [Infundibulicybe gibba]
MFFVIVIPRAGEVILEPASFFKSIPVQDGECVTGTLLHYEVAITLLDLKLPILVLSAPVSATAMSINLQSASVDSASIVPIFTSAEFSSIYNNNDLSTDILSDKALTTIVRPNSEFPRAADPRYRLDDFLAALLTHAPHQLGKRYIAVALHVAHDKGVTAVANVAQLRMNRHSSR